MESNWTVELIQNALDRWGSSLTEIWQLVSTSPADFRGGSIWSIITSINHVMQGFGFGLLVLFWAMGVFKSSVNFQDFKRPENGIRLLFRFALAKIAVSGAMDLMTTIFKIAMGTVTTVISHVGGSMTQTLTVPTDVVTKIDDLGFVQSIPVWLLAFVGYLCITALSLYILFVVYGRFFKLFSASGRMAA